VKANGPLPQAEAVDIILQVIAGLEAAAAGGVLHRDVKPSNCFVDSEGRVKVGDFGLSISTLARAERDLTMTGTIFGTPAFASPEQLRGEDLDVRSDIYSVGATLHFLLTGRPPFEEAHLIKLVTMIAQDAPPSLTELRPDVARGLAQIVMHCLAKRRDARVPTYAALAKELGAFCSHAPRPATVGRRVAAGLIDWLILGLLLTPVAVYVEWMGMESPADFPALARQVAYLLVGAAYFGVLEGRFGASVGKALCRLRVSGLDGSEPWLSRALTRGALFSLAMRAPSFFVRAGSIAPPHPPINFNLWGSEAQLTFGYDITPFWYVGLMILFVTARRYNGFAGLHDLVSRTRVVVEPTNETRSIARPSTDFVDASSCVGRIGPYLIVEPLGDNLLLGYDERLRRRVWIRLVSPGTPALAAHRRDLSRPGRLHWLTGRRSAAECWDAYEAVDGRPLATLLGTPTPWIRVRHWLHDLSAEVSASLADQTTPELALDRVWITSDDRAKLLDWEAPGINAESAFHAGPQPANLGIALHFLSAVASSALIGRVGHNGQADTLPVEPLPLSARGFLEELDEQRFKNIRQVREALNPLVASPARIDRRTRWVHLVICGALPALVCVYFVPGFFLLFRWMTQHPERVELTTCVHHLQLLEQDSVWPRPSQDLERIGLSDVEVQRIVRALQVHVAQSFRATGVDPSRWEEPFMDRGWRTTVARALAEHPSPSAEELADTADIVGRFLENRRNAPGPTVGFLTLLAAVLLPLISLLPLAVLGPLLAAILRGGLLFRFLGIGVVDASGAETSRVRAAVRATIAWLPFVIAGLEVFFFMDESGSVPRLPWLPQSWIVLIVLSGALLAGVVWAATNPQRGLQDRIAGTTLVPR
jgi:hypothetical protein